MAKTKAKQIALSAINGLTNPSADVQGGIADLQRKKIGAIEATSQTYLEIVDTPNGGELKVKALLITKVFTDNTYTTLADWIAGAGYPATFPMEEGDTIILTNATGGTQIYINNGGGAGTTADFTLIRNPDVTPAFIRSQLSAGNGISYNSTTGVISVKISALGGLMFNGTDLEVNVDGVTIRRNATTGALEVINTVGNVDAEFIKIDAAVAGVASGGSVQDALEALDAKQALGTKEVGTQDGFTVGENTNFNVMLPHAPIATQTNLYWINNVPVFPVGLSGNMVTFNVPYIMDTTDELRYEYFY